MSLNLSWPHMTWTLATLTMNRLLRRRSTLFMLAIGLLPCAVFIFWTLQLVFPDLRTNVTPFGMMLNIISIYFLSFYVPLVAIFLGLGVISDEIETKNITFTLVRPLPRWSIVIGRFLGHLIVASILVTFCLFANFLANLVFQLEEFGNGLWLFINASFVLSFGLAAYLSIVAAFGTFWKKFAILASIFWLVFDNLFSRVPIDFMNFLSVMYRMSASFVEKIPFFGFSGTSIDSSSAFLNFLWCMVYVALAGGLMTFRIGREVLLTEGEK